MTSFSTKARQHTWQEEAEWRHCGPYIDFQLHKQPTVLLFVFFLRQNHLQLHNDKFLSMMFSRLLGKTLYGMIGIEITYVDSVSAIVV